jgi:hypothetical protein
MEKLNLNRVRIQISGSALVFKNIFGKRLVCISNLIFQPKFIVLPLLPNWPGIRVMIDVKCLSTLSLKQLCGSGSVGSIRFWATRIH